MNNCLTSLAQPFYMAVLLPRTSSSFPPQDVVLSCGRKASFLQGCML
jgi:hypothetical protein